MEFAISLRNKRRFESTFFDWWSHLTILIFNIVIEIRNIASRWSKRDGPLRAVHIKKKNNIFLTKTRLSLRFIDKEQQDQSFPVWGLGTGFGVG